MEGWKTGDMMKVKNKGNWPPRDEKEGKGKKLNR